MKISRNIIGALALLFLSTGFIVPACQTLEAGSELVYGGSGEIPPGTGSGEGSDLENDATRLLDKEFNEAMSRINHLNDAKVERIKEGIKITIQSDLLFKPNAAEIKEEQIENLLLLGRSLLTYEHTKILITGHTDSMGAGTYNQELSEERAISVSRFLQLHGIAADRITTRGYGESKPISDNLSDEGRERNRRVDMIIYASKKMVKMAEKGRL